MVSADITGHVCQQHGGSIMGGIGGLLHAFNLDGEFFAAFTHLLGSVFHSQGKQITELTLAICDPFDHGEDCFNVPKF